MWNAIQESDLLTVLAGPELSAYRSAALAANQPDPVAAQVANVTNLVRGYIAGWLANTLGPEGTIPDKLLSTALDILVVKIPSRCGGVVPSPVRAEALDSAMALLKDVAAGRFKLEVPAPGTATTEQIATVAPTISSRDGRQLRRREWSS
jgi:hypothetical protein